jgi:hypothetical protein
MDVNPIVSNFDPEEHGSLAFIHPVVPQLPFGLIPFRQWGELPGVIEQGLESGLAVGCLETGN